MNPVPISDRAARAWPGFRRLVVAGPNGDLTNDGSSPDRATALEALRGEHAGWPLFVERWVPEPHELEWMEEGGELELRLYVPRLVVHSLVVHPPDADGRERRTRLNRAEFRRRTAEAVDEVCERAEREGLYGDREDIKKLVGIVHEVEMERIYRFVFDDDDESGEGQKT